MENNKTIKGEIFKIDPRNIVVVKDFNSRTNFGDIDELAAQIKEQGVLNPISTIPFVDEDGFEKYKLVDGERRYRAVMKLINEGVEIARIPSLLLSKSTSEEELLLQQALRNEGKPFNAYEWGVLAKKLMDRCGLTQSEVAKKLGKNQSVISRYLGYLELDPKLSSLLKDDVISGSNLDRIMYGAEGDQNRAYKEVTKLLEKAKEKGRKKISLKDCTLDSNTIIYKDSTIIKKGFNTFMKYVQDYSRDGKNEIKIDMTYIINELNNGKTITQIFDTLKCNEYLKAN